MFEASLTQNNRVFQIAVVVACAFLLLAVASQFTCRSPSGDQIESIVRKSPGLSQHDAFCTSLPHPEDFRPIRKSLGGNSSTTEIGYYYSSEMPFAEVRDFYLERLGVQGWRKSGYWDEPMTPVPISISFKRDEYTVTVELVSALGIDEAAQYAVGCSKEGK